MGIDQIGKNFVKSMSVKKFSYLGQLIQGLRTPGFLRQTCWFLWKRFSKNSLILNSVTSCVHKLCWDGTDTFCGNGIFAVFFIVNSLFSRVSEKKKGEATPLLSQSIPLKKLIFLKFGLSIFMKLSICF